MAEVFISYSRKDIEYADKLRAFLEDAGIRTWMDRSDIETGEEWETRIIQALTDCGAFVVIMSSNSVYSEWVTKEIELAKELTKPIFPLLLGDSHFVSLRHLQAEPVLEGELPRCRFPVMLARQLAEGQGSPSQQSSYTSEHRKADLMLLTELWRLMNTDRLQYVNARYQSRWLLTNDANTVFWSYEQFRNKPEKHFHNMPLEEAFVRLDEAMARADEAIWAACTSDNQDGRRLVVPDYTVTSQSAYYEKLNLHNEAIGQLTALLQEQRNTVYQIRTEFPEFHFEADNADLEER